MNPRILSLVWPGIAFALVSPFARSQCVHSLTPATHETYAGWGTSVAMSGNGEVVIVGGPGAHDSDGRVRTFSWNESSWEEQVPLSPEPQYAFAAEFGWSVALSYDGNTAAVGAPGDRHADFGKRILGAVYVFTRDPGTGEWSQQARLTKPTPGNNEAFGQAVALSDSGDQLVVGQRNHVGTEWANVPDSAWVFSRVAGTWSPPVELVGTELAAADEFGAAVALSPDGQRAVVSATGEGQTDGRVFLYRHEGGAWPLEQVLDHPEATGVWDAFGFSVAMGDGILMVGNPFYDNPDAGTENSGAVHVFDYDGVAWVGQPELLRLHNAWDWYGFGHSLALRGDYVLVGCPNTEVVHIVKLIDGKWTSTGVIRSNDPQENTRFGWAVAFTADRADYAVGEPSATVEGMISEGRVHFANAASAPYDFVVEPADSIITMTIRFLGYPVEIAISLSGEIVGVVTDDCEGAGSFLVTDVALESAEPIVFEMPPQLPEPLGGTEVVVSDVQIGLAEAGEAVVLDDTGLGFGSGSRLEISGLISSGGAAPTSWVFVSEPAAGSMQLTGGDGQPFDLRTDVFVRDLPIDVGLEDLNPTVSLSGGTSSTSVSKVQLDLSVCGMQAEGFCVEVSGTAGLEFIVEASPELIEGSWVTVNSGTLGADPIEVIDRDAKNHRSRYYRARTP